ncbi:MAG: cupin domain-containing protein [Bacteroidota bacterium]
MDQLQQEFRTPVHTNIYITPSNSSGFAPHYDKHEVFVLQVHGTKRWHIYDKPYDDINRSTLPREKSQEYADSTPVHDLVLYPGDLLYIPKGVVHKAHTEDHDSIHITLGVNYVRESNLLSRLLRTGKFEDDTDITEAEDVVLDKLVEKLKATSKEQKDNLFGLDRDEFFDAKGLFTGAMVVGLINSSEDLDHINIEPAKGEPYTPPSPVQSTPIDDVKQELKDELIKGEIKLSLK